MHLGADYRICQTGPDGLSKEELEKRSCRINRF